MTKRRDIPKDVPPELAAMLDALPIPGYIIDGEGSILLANAEVKTKFDWKVSALTGRNISDILLFPLPFRSVLLQRLGEHGSIHEESERLMPDGTVRPVRTQWKLLRRTPLPALYLGTDVDLAEARLREQELEQARKLAKIGVLSEGIAHELRNPLSYALSAVQLLSDDRISEEVRSQCIQTINTGLRKAGLIVDNLLSLGKPRTQFERALVNLHDVVAEAQEAAAAHPSYRKVRITESIAAPDSTVEGNHDMLVQVFHNVITNALNELPEGGRIDITGERCGNGLCVRIADTGPGVSEEQMRHLFDPFYTASSSGTGTGLGLTLSYYIMKEHGGSIEVESRPGGGAVFVLHFPAADADP